MYVSISKACQLPGRFLRESCLISFEKEAITQYFKRTETME